MYICATWVEASICSADGSTHTETNKLYGKVKHRYRPNLSPRQRPTAKSRHDQAALAASAEARGATHRRWPRSPSPHSHSGIDEKRPTEKFVKGGCICTIHRCSRARIYRKAAAWARLQRCIHGGFRSHTCTLTHTSYTHTYIERGR